MYTDQHVFKYNADENYLLFQRDEYTEKWFRWDSENGGFRAETTKGNWPCEETIASIMCVTDEYPEFGLIRNSIPNTAFVAAAQCYEFAFQVLLLCQQNLDFCARLSAKSPALLVLFAEALCNSDDVSGFLSSFKKLHGKSRKEIAALTGIHGEVLTVLFKAIDPTFSIASNAHLLLSVTKNRRAVRCLKHLALINMDIAVLAHQYPELLTSCPILFHWISKQSVLIDLEICGCVIRIIELRKLLRLEKLFPYHNLQSEETKALMRIEAKLSDKASKQNLFLKKTYPPPPILGYDLLKPVTDFETLEDLASRFDNCAIVFHNRIIAGLNYLYYTNEFQDEDVCVLLKKLFYTDTWEIDQIVAFQNSDPAPWLEEQIQELFM